MKSVSYTHLGTAYYLWDDNYIYMAATIKDTAITDASGDLVWQDNVALTFFNSKDGKGDWTMARGARIVISPTAGKIPVSYTHLS